MVVGVWIGCVIKLGVLVFWVFVYFFVFVFIVVVGSGKLFYYLVFELSVMCLGW